MTTEPIIARGIVMNDESIKSLIKEAMTEVLGECSVKCPLPADVVSEVSHFFGVVRDTGDGDLRRGVEEVRENMRLIAGLRKTRDKLTDWVGKTIIITLIAGFLTFLWFAIKESLKNLVR